jgi:Arc/MetJ-type ribon-helix-helix transcriptional regulator
MRGRIHVVNVKVVVPQSLEEYVNSLVGADAYPGISEVVEEALREHQARRQGLEVVMTPELGRLLDEGLENLECARTTEELRRLE